MGVQGRLEVALVRNRGEVDHGVGPVEGIVKRLIIRTDVDDGDLVEIGFAGRHLIDAGDVMTERGQPETSVRSMLPAGTGDGQPHDVMIPSPDLRART